MSDTQTSNPGADNAVDWREAANGTDDGNLVEIYNAADWKTQRDILAHASSAAREFLRTKKPIPPPIRRLVREVQRACADVPMTAEIGMHYLTNATDERQRRNEMHPASCS
ncbi:hypothetical protein HGRIS_005375 [Hohenbuehelia grisea]|uniref:Uncharacterized protein n=1 Tax=Hohenbuehelia grisea TaxID=104357 RepID=A0ABR3JFF7_9AGAR